jgi:hypothetical protein
MISHTLQSGFESAALTVAVDLGSIGSILLVSGVKNVLRLILSFLGSVWV